MPHSEEDIFRAYFNARARALEHEQPEEPDRMLDPLLEQAGYESDAAYQAALRIASSDRNLAAWRINERAIGIVMGLVAAEQLHHEKEGAEQ